MPIHAIDHMQLAKTLGEENAARAFYAGILGFAEIPKPAILIDSPFLAAAKARPAFVRTNYANLRTRTDRRPCIAA